MSASEVPTACFMSESAEEGERRHIEKAAADADQPVSSPTPAPMAIRKGSGLAGAGAAFSSMWTSGASGGGDQQHDGEERELEPAVDRVRAIREPRSEPSAAAGAKTIAACAFTWPAR